LYGVELVVRRRRAAPKAITDVGNPKQERYNELSHKNTPKPMDLWHLRNATDS